MSDTVFVICWESPDGNERIDQAQTEPDAHYLVQEYRLAFGDPNVWFEEIAIEED